MDVLGMNYNYNKPKPRKNYKHVCACCLARVIDSDEPSKVYHIPENYYGIDGKIILRVGNKRMHVKCAEELNLELRYA